MSRLVVIMDRTNKEHFHAVNRAPRVFLPKMHYADCLWKRIGCRINADHSARLRRLYSSMNLLLERFGMYQIAIDRVSGGLRVMRSLRKTGDVFTLRNILDRNESYYRQNANEVQLREFEEIKSAVMAMTEKEAREGVGACLDLSHPSVVSAYNRPVPRIVAIVDNRGGLI